MTGDFFSVLWDSEIPSHVEAAARINSALARSCPHLTLALSINGIQVYTGLSNAGARTIQVLADGKGLVFGTLFTRDHEHADAAPSPRVTLGGQDASRILESSGRYLVDNYWGHYLAFLIDDRNRTKWVFRSPACHQPCLCATYQGVRLYFSAVEDCAALGLLNLTVNWDFLAAFCAFARASGPETGLNEIRELSTGEYHTFSPGVDCRGYHWNPGNFARSPLRESALESRRRLRAAVLSCVSTWAAEHASIVQRLSGGLDSSIATACLALAPSQPRVTCLNYHSHGAYGDERDYARAVAKKVGFRLIEYRYDSEVPMSLMLTYRRTESPASYLMRDGCDRREIELAEQVGATARFTGILGDMLFQMPPAAPTAADYVRLHGIDRRFLHIVHEAAQIDRISIWRVLHGAMMDGLLTPPKSFVPGDFRNPDHSLLTREARESACYADPLRFVHPWLHHLGGIPSGKFPMIASLSWNSTYFNALRDPCESELIHPYFSEPLMELCLRLPSYSLLHGGWDRALVREAFAPELPDIVRSRVSKGSPNLPVRERIENNRTFIRDTLTEGVLVKQGVLDRKKIADCLPGNATRTAISPADSWACVAAEVWSRSWSSHFA